MVADYALAALFLLPGIGAALVAASFLSIIAFASMLRHAITAVGIVASGRYRAEEPATEEDQSQ